MKAAEIKIHTVGDFENENQEVIKYSDHVTKVNTLQEEVKRLEWKLNAVEGKNEGLKEVIESLETKPEGKPNIIPVIADNGDRSHWALIGSKTGEKLWSEDPEECKAMGYPVKSQPSVTESEPLSAEKILLEHTASSNFEQMMNLDWTTAEVIDVFDKAFREQSQPKEPSKAYRDIINKVDPEIVKQVKEDIEALKEPSKTVEEACLRCSGKGNGYFNASSELVQCDYCNGTGKVIANQPKEELSEEDRIYHLGDFTGEEIVKHLKNNYVLAVQPELTKD